MSSFSKVLVLGNKRDLPNALDEKQLIEKMYVLRMRGAVGAEGPLSCGVSIARCLAVSRALFLVNKLGLPERWIQSLSQ